jgi:hypothetical protein
MQSSSFSAVLLLGALSLLACGEAAVPDETEPTDRSSSPIGGDPAPAAEVPEALVAALGRDRTYVEENCASTTYPDWPYPAQRCTYRDNLVVTIANPSRDRVARWILDASRLIPALDGLRDRDRTNWEKGLVVIARHTVLQSSRIFPLDGQVWENGTTYRFERGVTKTCSTGCYCRVNSMSRPNWCAYAANVLGTEDEAACLVKYGQPSGTLTEEWLRHCFENHVTSWDKNANEHYRARAWQANQTIAPQFPDPGAADGATVVRALAALF